MFENLSNDNAEKMRSVCFRKTCARGKERKLKNNSLEMTDKEILLSLAHKKTEERDIFFEIRQIQNLQKKYLFRLGGTKLWDL